MTARLRPWEIAHRHRDLARRYTQLRDLEGGLTPHQRGTQLNHLIAEVLAAYGISTRVSERGDLGEIDVAFSLDGTRFVLEAKWHEQRIDFGPVNLLATRTRQRLEGTLGIFVSMSGYTAPTLDQLGRSGERVRIILFDDEHVEALVAGVAAPHELIVAAVEEAGATGRFYVSVADLLHPHDRAAQPPVVFGPPPGYEQQLVAYAAKGVAAAIVLHSGEDIRGIAADADGGLLLALPDGLAKVDLAAGTARWVLGLRWIDRNPLVDPVGHLWLLRGAAAVHVDKNHLRPAASGFGGASTLFPGPDGHAWVLNRWAATAFPRNQAAQLVRVGQRLGDEEHYDLTRYPAEAALNAAFLDGERCFILGPGHSARISLRDLDNEQWTVTPIASPQGLTRLSNDRLVVAGDKDGVTLVDIAPDTGEGVDLLQLNLSGSVSELARNQIGLYLRSHAPVGHELMPVVVEVTGVGTR